MARTVKTWWGWTPQDTEACGGKDFTGHFFYNDSHLGVKANRRLTNVALATMGDPDDFVDPRLMKA